MGRFEQLYNAIAMGYTLQNTIYWDRLTGIGADC
jgi:hypothetical protein